MRVVIDSLLEGARRAEGTVVVIDVYRAFTTAAVAFDRGAGKIVLVAEINEALALREQGIGELCVGEVDGIMPKGFDFGNSPHQLSTADVAGRAIIQSTRAGTVGMTAVAEADALYAGSLCTAKATAEIIRREKPKVVTLVAMGWSGHTRADEDEHCALYLRNLLEGRTPDPDAVRTLVLAGGESQKFGDPAQPHFHPMDREIALRVDRFDFAIRVTRENGLLIARPVANA